GPRPVLELRDLPAEVVLDLERLVRRHADRRAVDLDADAEPLERRQDRAEVVRFDVFDGDLAAGHRREADEAADLDVLGPDSVAAAVEPLDAFDPDRVRADALDARAERDEEIAEVLHVRLARRVRDHR